MSLSPRMFFTEPCHLHTLVGAQIVGTLLNVTTIEAKIVLSTNMRNTSIWSVHWRFPGSQNTLGMRPRLWWITQFDTKTWFSHKIVENCIRFQVDVLGVVAVEDMPSNF